MKYEFKVKDYQGKIVDGVLEMQNKDLVIAERS